MLRDKVFSGILLIALGLFSATTPAAEKPDMATASIDRSWGLLLGDKVVVTSILPVQYRAEINEDTLPARKQQLGYWLFLDAITFEEQNNAALIMRAHYQVTNTPAQTAQVGTPEFTIRKTDNTWLTIPAVPMTLSSLLPLEDTADITMQADRPTPIFNTIRLKQRTFFWAMVAVICFGLSFLWFVLWGKKNRQPFEQALVELKKLKNKKEHAAAARVVHHAFNQTAGETVVQGSITDLLTNVPRLTALQADIETFYRASAQSFFNPAADTSLHYDDMLKLVKACRNKERLT